MTLLLGIAAIVFMLLFFWANLRRVHWLDWYRGMLPKLAEATSQLTLCRQRLSMTMDEWQKDRSKLMRAMLDLGRMGETLEKLFPEDRQAILLCTPSEYVCSVLRRQKELLDKREALDKSLNSFCDYKTLEMLVRRAETMPQINMPRGVKVFTDELGNVLFSPGAVGMPKRYFVYLYRPSGQKPLNGKEFHVTEKPAFYGAYAKMVFVQDEWLTHGEVIGKLAAAAKTLSEMEIKR